MRAELFRPEDPARVVAVAEWGGSAAVVGRADDDVREAVERVFRVSSVVADDPSRRPLGAAGPVVLEPGSLDWFLTAARVRGEAEGLGVRFSTETPGGWDPAGSYRRLGEWLGDRESRAGAGRPRP